MKKISDFLDHSLEIFSLSLKGVLLLFCFMLLGVSLSIYTATVVTINEYILGLLNMSYTLLLLVVTAIYVFFTYGILEETTKAQKISFIEKRLKEFYYPLLQILNLRPNSHDGTAVFVGSVDPRADKMHKIYEIDRCLYLAKKENKNLIKKFMEGVCKKKFFSINKEFQELKTIIIEDITYFEDKLNSLVDE